MTMQEWEQQVLAAARAYYFHIAEVDEYGYIETEDRLVRNLRLAALRYGGAIHRQTTDPASLAAIIQEAAHYDH